MASASSTSPAQQDFLNAIAVLTPEERAHIMRLVIALSNSGHRQYRCHMVMQILERMDSAPSHWSVLNRDGKQRMIVSLVNGQITGIEITSHV